MKVADLMTRKVVSVAPDLSIGKLAALLVEQRISAAPVVAADGGIIGIVSESDIMRRPEIGTGRRASWLQAFADPDELAERYIKAHGLAVKDVMTPHVVTVRADAALVEAAELMETNRVKRLPVLQDGKLVGIIARADLIRALAAVPPLAVGADDDAVIRQRIEEEMQRESWVRKSDLYVTVVDHVAHLWGLIDSPTQSEALEALARAVPGVSGVKNHLRNWETDAHGRFRAL